jgi:hypothetical protein
LIEYHRSQIERLTGQALQRAPDALAAGGYRVRIINERAKAELDDAHSKLERYLSDLERTYARVASQP